MIFAHAGDPYDVGKIGLECPPLPFQAGALEPVLSRESVAAHYGQHQAYCRNAQRIVEEHDDLSGDETLLSLVKYASHHRDFGGPNDLFSQAGQAWNHAFLWLSLRSPKAGPTKFSQMPQDWFEETALGSRALDLGFKSFVHLRDEFIDVAKNSFGSQWAWLVYRGTEKWAPDELAFVVTDGADSPVVRGNVMPLLVIDLWEHAYYSSFRFDRARYVEECVTNLLDWDRADALMTLWACA